MQAKASAARDSPVSRPRPPRPCPVQAFKKENGEQAAVRVDHPLFAAAGNYIGEQETMSQVRIEIRELPPRTKSLSAAEYASIFGGACSAKGQPCDKDEDCCEGLVCRSVDPLYPYFAYCRNK